jgi:hypothetical protein
MELAGLEPASSWVRSRRSPRTFCGVEFALCSYRVRTARRRLGTSSPLRRQKAANLQSRRPGLEPGTPSLRAKCSVNADAPLAAGWRTDCPTSVRIPANQIFRRVSKTAAIPVPRSKGRERVLRRRPDREISPSACPVRVRWSNLRAGFLRPDLPSRGGMRRTTPPRRARCGSVPPWLARYTGPERLKPVTRRFAGSYSCRVARGFDWAPGFDHSDQGCTRFRCAALSSSSKRIELSRPSQGTWL